jgi:inorganic pyrophosphatase
MENANRQVTEASTYLGKKVAVTIERPLLSKHPKYGWPYQLNYGYVPGTMSPDGEELDAYVIGPKEPLKEFTGTCIAVIHRTNDNDDKLVVVSDDKTGMTDEDIRNATDFQEKFFQSVIRRAA